jgi:hypothetical protein
MLVAFTVFRKNLVAAVHFAVFINHQCPGNVDFTLPFNMPFACYLSLGQSYSIHGVTNNQTDTSISVAGFFAGGSDLRELICYLLLFYGTLAYI